MRDLAVRLAREAGAYAVAEARQVVEAQQKGAGADVVTHVDHEAERRIIAGIRERFPDHAILGEESGRHGSADASIRWLVDPLDGTNNYVLGLPSYGVCITACQGDEPVVAVAYDSVGEHCYAAIAGRGATRDDALLTLGDAARLDHTTVSWVQGYAVTHDDDLRNGVFTTLERTCKRVLRTWSPSIDWGLLATGRTGALVAYRNEIWDLVGGILIAREAGAALRTSESGDLVLVGHPVTVAELAQVLGEMQDVRTL